METEVGGRQGGRLPWHLPSQSRRAAHGFGQAPPDPLQHRAEGILEKATEFRAVRGGRSVGQETRQAPVDHRQMGRQREAGLLGNRLAAGRRVIPEGVDQDQEAGGLVQGLPVDLARGDMSPVDVTVQADPLGRVRGHRLGDGMHAPGPTGTPGPRTRSPDGRPRPPAAGRSAWPGRNARRRRPPGRPRCWPPRSSASTTGKSSRAGGAHRRRSPRGGGSSEQAPFDRLPGGEGDDPGGRSCQPAGA